MAHIFTTLCPDFDHLLASVKLTDIMKASQAQARKKDIIKKIDPLNKGTASMVYAGHFLEWFAEEFLNYYGAKWKITNTQMNNQLGVANKDLGVDGMASTAKECTFITAGLFSRKAKVGSPVFIQVKGTTNKEYEFTANDEHHVTNFVAYAATHVINTNHAYQSRFLLFTTGAGLHYSLKLSTNNLIEVINYNQIRACMDGDYNFINHV
jgi:hypothetical protein